MQNKLRCGKIKNLDMIKTLYFPNSIHEIGLKEDISALYNRAIWREISQKIEKYGLSYLYKDTACIVLKGRKKGMKKFLRWYKREIIKNGGLKITKRRGVQNKRRIS
jgi:hypothetical protein